MRELMLQAGQEALDIGAALGHPVLPIFGMKPDEVRLSNRLVETMLDTLLAGFTLPHTKTTVLQDWMKGRRSEVDDLNGLVAAEAVRLGRAAPVNAAIADLAHQVEQVKIKPALANLHLLQDLARR
jgi:2-dehydropantoate 2-reductase